MNTPSRLLRNILAPLLVFMAAVPIANVAFAPAALADWGQSSNSDQPINENPLEASLQVQPAQVGIGGTGEFVITMKLAEGHHAYLEQFKFAVDAPDGLKVDRFRINPIIQFMDNISKKMKDGIKGEAEMRVLFEVPSGFKTGTQEADVRLTYQACTEDHCLFPKTIHLKSPFKITEGMQEKGTASTPMAQAKSDFETALGKGLIPALVFVFFIGFLTSLTPCIYPMIPITLAVLGARSKNHGHDKIRSLALSVTYVLGIALSYSALGVTAATTGALFGSALSNIWVVTALALVFVAMGLSMYGVFEIQAPAFLRNRAGTAKTDAGYFGAFATGVIAGIVASPCVGPVLVSILAYIAKTQDKLLGFVFLFTFALGMGVLFIALGLSSTLLHRLPKAGSWMEGVKFIFGTTMVAMALYYIAPLYPLWLFRFLLGLAVVLIASSFGAFMPTSGLTAFGRVRKGLMLAAFFIGTAIAAAGLLDRMGVKWIGAQSEGSAPQNALAADEGFPKLAWKPYSDQALADALTKKQPVLIDFYADWCVACKELERYTFIDPRVRGLSDRYALLKVDATEDSSGLDKLKKKYRVLGLPTMIFYDTSGKVRDELTLTGFEAADPFLTRMKAAAGSP